MEKGLSPNPRIIFAPSGANDSELYKTQTVSTLLRAVSEYSVRHLRPQIEVPSPTQILLAYVPAADEERLLAQFDFFVFPVRLTRLAEYDVNGRQHRHSPKVAEGYIAPMIETALRAFSEIKRRISNATWTEPLCLPPRNFKVSDTERIADIFREMRQSKRPWGSPLPEIRSMRVSHELLPANLREGASREVFADSRDLLFPPDNSHHGVVRELTAGCADAERKLFMQSAFRFGAPLRDGYHHDVQYGGRDLRGTMFECSRRGVIPLSCTYANVYPNDFVRPSK